MSILERAGNSGRVSIVAAGEVSYERPYTFFQIEFPLRKDCAEIVCGSARFPLVARWQNGRLDWDGAEAEGKVKRLDDDPSHGSLRVIGAISDDGNIFLHEDLVANGNREQAEAYCMRLVKSFLGD